MEGRENKPLEVRRTEEVGAVTSFEQLFETLKRFGMIGGIGGVKEYSAVELIDRIERVRADRMDLHTITRAYGIRDKVHNLIAAEKGGERE